MTQALVAYVCAGLVGLGILLAIIGSVVARIRGGGKPGFKLQSDNSPGFDLKRVISGGLIIGVAVVVLFFDGLWWLWSHYFIHVTPGKLALISIGIGVFPLVISSLSFVAAKLMGGSVDGRGAKDCRLLGINMNGVVETMFMSFVLGFITIGLGFLGLMVSGIWALID